MQFSWHGHYVLWRDGLATGAFLGRDPEHQSATVQACSGQWEDIETRQPFVVPQAQNTRAGAQQVQQQLAAFWTRERLTAVVAALVHTYLPLTVRA